MRNELFDLYKLACANPKDKDIVLAYQRAKDRIGPQIAIHEAMENDALLARVARLEEALLEIRDYDSYKHPDESIIALREAAIKESNDCTACQHAKQAKWPPSGLCNKHYILVTNAPVNWQVQLFTTMFNDLTHFVVVQLPASLKSNLRSFPSAQEPKDSPQQSHQEAPESLALPSQITS